MDIEAESARVIHTTTLDRLADLTKGDFELEVWDARGPHWVRFRLEQAPDFHADASEMHYAPGFYDVDGELHIDVPEVLRSKGIEPTPEIIEATAQLFAQAAREQLPDTSDVVIE